MDTYRTQALQLELQHVCVMGVHIQDASEIPDGFWNVITICPLSRRFHTNIRAEMARSVSATLRCGCRTVYQNGDNYSYIAWFPSSFKHATHIAAIAYCCAYRNDIMRD